MSVIGRRAFVRRLAVSAAAVIACPVFAQLAPAPPTRVVDRQLGIAIRFIRSYDVKAAKAISSFDVFMARPLLAGRVDG